MFQCVHTNTLGAYNRLEATKVILVRSCLLNTDLYNLKLFPDYSATPLHTFTASDSWTATENCYIVGSFRHTSSGQAAMYVDSVPVAECWGQTGSVDTANIQLMVKKGSVVTTNSLVGKVVTGGQLPSAYPLTN